VAQNEGPRAIIQDKIHMGRYEKVLRTKEAGVSDTKWEGKRLERETRAFGMSTHYIDKGRRSGNNEKAGK
jgi:hypothetical protein